MANIASTLHWGTSFHGVSTSQPPEHAKASNAGVKGKKQAYCIGKMTEYPVSDKKQITYTTEAGIKNCEIISGSTIQTQLCRQ